MINFLLFICINIDKTFHNLYNAKNNLVSFIIERFIDLYRYMLVDTIFALFIDL